MISSGDTTTLFIHLQRTRVRRINLWSDVLAGLDSEQVAERKISRNNGALWILRNCDTYREDLHDSLKLRNSFLELGVQIANLLFGRDLSGYIGVGAKPSHQTTLRVADRYGAREKPAILPFFA